MKTPVLAASAIAIALSLSGCAPLLSAALGGLTGSSAPPTAAPLQATSIDEAGIDLIRDLFDTALFGVEALRDLHRPCCTPGTPEAHNVANLIREITRYLNVANRAQQAAQSGNYNDALRNARAAFRLFQGSIGQSPTDAATFTPAEAQNARVMRLVTNMSDADRLAIADRLDGGDSARGASQ
jgi:hypothetical protein